MTDDRSITAANGQARPRVAVLGATLGTGNLGVDALGMSMVQGLVEAIPNVEIVYQCWDLRLPITIQYGDKVVECEPMALRRKNSLRRRDGLLQIRRMAQLRNWLSNRAMPQLPTISRAFKQLLNCDAVLDVSAGDSFANIYGDENFWYQSQLKLLCLELGLPLVLMPQTYGPFSNRESEQTAADILSRSTLVCSREEHGLNEVKQLCGDRPPQSLYRVPDMAFLLEPTETPLPESFEQALRRNSTCIALNISGLLYFARRSFGLHGDYKELSRRVIQWALSIPDSYLLLLPHVVAPTLFSGAKLPNVATSDTTDTGACEELLADLSPAELERVGLLAEPSDPARAKYAMKHCDYFIGARMHAFIGASSQHVPGTLFAYSKKAEGLATLMGIADSVVDLRSDTIDECIAGIDQQFQRRQTTKAHLQAVIPQAKSEIRKFFAEEIAPLVLRQERQPMSTAKCDSIDEQSGKKKVLS
ncbi:MAG: polysaccharide pyruvyl transferase family protein [Planctomycetota bacterium]